MRMRRNEEDEYLKVVLTAPDQECFRITTSKGLHWPWLFLVDEITVVGRWEDNGVGSETLKTGNPWNAVAGLEDRENQPTGLFLSFEFLTVYGTEPLIVDRDQGRRLLFLQRHEQEVVEIVGRVRFLLRRPRRAWRCRRWCGCCR